MPLDREQRRTFNAGMAAARKRLDRRFKKETTMKPKTQKFRRSVRDLTTETWTARATKTDWTVNVFNGRQKIAHTTNAFCSDRRKHNAMPEVAHEKIAAVAIAAVPEMLTVLLAAAEYIAATANATDGLHLLTQINAALWKAGLRDPAAPPAAQQADPSHPRDLTELNDDYEPTEKTPQAAVQDALAVLMLDERISRAIAKTDPNAFEQAETALKNVGIEVERPDLRVRLTDVDLTGTLETIKSLAMKLNPDNTIRHGILGEIAKVVGMVQDDGEDS